MPWRSPDRCRDRFVNVLDPKLTKKHWTHLEDLTVAAMLKKVGKNWDLIAKMLPGRNVNGLQYHYTRFLRQRINKKGELLPKRKPANN